MPLQIILSQLAEHETMLKLAATREELYRLQGAIHALREELRIVKERSRKEEDRELEERAKEILAGLMRKGEFLISHRA